LRPGHRLSLGICGVTTMFSVVNGVMLRGFHFERSPDGQRQLHRSGERHVLRVNGQVSSMDFEEFRTGQYRSRKCGLSERIDRQRHH
jgi:hypothetical protein